MCYWYFISHSALAVIETIFILCKLDDGEACKKLDQLLLGTHAIVVC